MSEKELLAYTAGVIDGEGTFYRGNPKNSRGYRNPQSQVIVIQTDIRLLDFLKDQFGGGICISPGGRSDLSRKACYRWTLLGKAAEALALKLQPYLIVKQEQVKRLIDFPRYYCKKSDCNMEFYKDLGYCGRHRRWAKRQLVLQEMQ